MPAQFDTVDDGVLTQVGSTDHSCLLAFEGRPFVGVLSGQPDEGVEEGGGHAAVILGRHKQNSVGQFCSFPQDLDFFGQN